MVCWYYSTDIWYIQVVALDWGQQAIFYMIGDDSAMLWQSQKNEREDGTQVYRSHILLCHSHERTDPPCDNCKNGICTTFDLSNLDISHLLVEDKIFGNLDYLGWVVVKAPYVGDKLGKSIDVISSCGDWTQISNHCAFIKFTQDSFNQNFIKWRIDEHVVQ